MVANLKQAMDLDATLNLMRSFRLGSVRSDGQVETIHQRGHDAASVKPGPEQVYQIDGQKFMVVEPEAWDWFTSAPFTGSTEIPRNSARDSPRDCGDRKTDTGGLVNVRIRDKGPQPPPERISTRGRCFLPLSRRNPRGQTPVR